ncbi:glycoside hydrolase family 88 protein [Geofilum sp. OHC36d9]|uniref:glycoside hydrolase family 88 protein n=1 Tax=Geofilum sp. OHC36d9 TaxID=3458413 RepID=UPI00403368A8
MRLYVFLGVLLFLAVSCKSNVTQKQSDSDQELLKNIYDQEFYALNLVNNYNDSDYRIFPRTIGANGKLKKVGRKDWTSGFYPGVLWMMYELTNDTMWMKEAAKFTGLLEKEKYNGGDHDIGFKMMCSYGQGYKLTGNKAYREVLIQSARTLITRFDEKVGCIRSWDHHKDKWQYPVIIDNMINLELLFWASRETGDSVFANIAIKHAQTTMKNHFRSDYSTYHVVSYDTITGKALKRQTHQGASDESCWARGEAWALYGYSMAYRETHLTEFLSQAEKVANYILNVAKLPEDNIPYWDYSLAGLPNEPRDVSAAAVMASAFFELYSFGVENGEQYLEAGNKIMKSLHSEAYFNETGTNGGFLLRHSTGSKPSNSEVDVPLIYADYYFLEALLRKKQIENSHLQSVKLKG